MSDAMQLIERIKLDAKHGQEVKPVKGKNSSAVNEMSLAESVAMYCTPKLPSDQYSKEFVNGKKGTLGNTVAFKAIPRSHALHLEDIKNTM